MSAWLGRVCTGVAVAWLLSAACSGVGSSTNGLSTPTPTTSSLASASPTSAAALVRCEEHPQQTYTNTTFGFSIACPSNFSRQTFSGSPGRLFSARIVDDKYLSGYPAGQVEISVAANRGNLLREWIASHIGPQYSGDANHFWDSTSNLTDIRIADRAGLSFEYVFAGPEGPPGFHAAAFLLPTGSVFVMDWWAYSPDYSPVIGAVAQQMIASIRVTG